MNLKNEIRKEKPIPAPGKEKYRSKVPVRKKELVASICNTCEGPGALKGPRAGPPGPWHVWKCLEPTLFCEQVLYSCIFSFPGAGMGFSFLISFLRFIFQFSFKIMFKFILIHF